MPDLTDRPAHHVGHTTQGGELAHYSVVSTPQVVAHRRGRLLTWITLLLVAAVASGGIAVAVKHDEPATPASVTGVAPSPGATAPGDLAYPVPPDAIVVSTTGRDGASGSASDPMPSIWAGIDKASDGGTVVIRGGTYHETVTIPPGKRLTLQAYPRETVWMDGGSTITGWESDGSGWKARLPVAFDHSPTYTWGAPESSVPGWQFLDPAHPLAAHPEQLWVDGSAQRQVSTRDQVVPGSFFIDEARQEVVAGTNPTGHALEATTLRQAIVVQSPGSVVRGLGIRRYADSVPHQGVLTVLAAGVTLENISIDQSSTTGLGVLSSDATVRGVTVTRSGMLGVAAFQSDRSVFDGLRLEGNNTEHFNHAPASGGLKATKSQHLTIERSRFAANDGVGLWIDESSFDIRLLSNDVEDNLDRGIVLEISAKAVIADNLVLNNTGDGILVADSGHVGIWNNTVLGNERGINLTQDGRDPNAPDAMGLDRRFRTLDPSVDWQLRAIDVHNNVVGLPNVQSDALVAVEDYTKTRRAEDLDLDINGNAYLRLDAGTPEWAVVWTRPGQDPQVFTTVEDFNAQTGQEHYRFETDGGSATDGHGHLPPSQQAAANSVARPLPADIANSIHQAAETRRMGASR